MSSGHPQTGLGGGIVLNASNLLAGNFSLPTSNGSMLPCFELSLVTQGNSVSGLDNNTNNMNGQNGGLQSPIENLQITAQQVQIQSIINETLSRDIPTHMVRKKHFALIKSAAHNAQYRFMSHNGDTRVILHF